VKHVVARSAGITTITIAARAAAGNLCITVQDDGPKREPADSAKPGVGLRNTAERLNARFGSEHCFSAAVLDPSGFRVDLEMPLRFQAG
jgi:LytS/YehU family sensor histidine kinase